MERTRPMTHEELTERVIASFEQAPPRLRQLMQALVTHLHAFAVEVGLTHEEWAEAIAVLNESGAISGDKRQEFILWSDSLGLSMLVDALEHRLPGGATESTVLGPFYVKGSPYREYGADLVAAEARDKAGDPAWVHGKVTDLDGEPVAGAELDVWQNGANRLYAVQDPEAPETHLRGRFTLREDGSYAFLAVRPVPYTIPSDGPVGRMLAATGRHPWRPAHLHLIARAPGYHSVATHIFDEDSEYLDSDAVFAVKPSLLRRFVRHGPDDPATPPGVDRDWYSVENDLVLAPLGGKQ